MAVQPWERVEPTTLVKVDRRSLVIKNFKQPDGNIHTFATMQSETARSGGVIALTPEGKVIVARQFRVGPERLMDEIPGGGIAEGEDPQAGVMRELLEETGYISNDVTFLGTSCRDAYTNANWYYYLAQNCQLSEAGQQLDEHEYVDVVLLSVDEFIQNAKTDKMTDPAAVLMAYDMLLELRKTAKTVL